MVLCKYFLQGTCRFGENCKFEHQINDHNYGGSSSILLQNYHSAAPKPASTTNIDTNTLIKAVVNDMTSAEKGGQWILSSYAPFKEKPQFPGFEDHSMEEVRFLHYEAMKSGAGEAFKQNLQMMLQQAMMKIKALQNPSPEAVSMLKSIYDSAPSGSAGGQTQAPFGGSSGSAIFGSPQSQKSIFGATAPTQSIFGGGTTQPQSVFNSPNSNPMFGGQTPATSSIFGAAPTPQQAANIFGRAQPTATNTGSIFGAPAVLGGAAPPQSQPLYTPQNNQSTVFGQLNPAFGQAPQPQNVFQQNTPFGASAPFNAASGPFGASQGVTQDASPLQNLLVGATAAPSKTPFQHTQNIFGAAAAPFFPNAAHKPNEEFYSKLEDLTEEEIKWFQSDDLDVMKIPEKPPTYEMCF